MRQLTDGVRGVMHMRSAERAEAGGAGPQAEVSGRVSDVGGRGRARSGHARNGHDEVVARMGVRLSAEQSAWVEEEAARRHLPKTAIVRELLDMVLTGTVPVVPKVLVGAGGTGDGGAVRDVGPHGAVDHLEVEQAHDDRGSTPGHMGVDEVDGVGAVDPDGLPVHSSERVGDVVGDGRPAVAGSGRRAARAPHAPDVEVVDAEPVGESGRRAGYSAAYPGAGGVYDGRRAPVRRRAPAVSRVRPYEEPQAGHPAAERVAVPSVRAVVGDPSAGEISGHASALPRGVGVPRAPVPGAGCSASTTFAAWRQPFLPVPVVVDRDQ